MKRLLHWIAHRLHLNACRTEWQDNELWVICRTCRRRAFRLSRYLNGKINRD